MTVHPWTRIGGRPEHRDWIRDPDKPYIPPEIDPTVYIQSFVTIDAGCHAATTIGARTLVLAHVHIGHDAVIGEDCELAPHCSVGGHVRIGNGVRVGQGAVFKPYVTVGAGARIGCGAVVVKDVPAGETWAGNPARPL